MTEQRPSPEPAAVSIPVSIIVPTHNRVPRLAECLAELIAAARPGDEIIVVDSASRDAGAVEAVVAALRSSPVDVQLVRENVPGASRARNAGWRAATRDVVVFVDDDVTVGEGWRERLVAPFSDRAVAFVAGRMAAAQSGGRPLAVRLGSRAYPVALGDPHPGASGNLAVRRGVLADVGGFDERLGPATWFAGAEDHDLLDRILLTGARGWFEPAAVVYGDQPQSSREARAKMWAYGKGAGARLAKLARADRSTARTLAPKLLPQLRRRP
ncbi:MAG: glycosyltransferase, partial [Frankiales bacterium]|nr:glycosyltransferase [Frankiales bacterium]